MPDTSLSAIADQLATGLEEDAAKRPTRRRGRPRKPRHTSVLSMRVSIALHDEVCQLAQAHGVDVQDIAKRALIAGLSVYRKSRKKQSRAS